MNGLPSWAGTLPAWITAGGVTGMLGILLRYLTQRRAQDGSRLTDLEKENRQLRKDFDEYRKIAMQDADKARRECQAELEAHTELINGLRAQMQQFQMHELEKAAEVPPATKERFQGEGK